MSIAWQATLRALRRDWLNRRLPHGLVHPGYLLPRPPAAMAWRRTLWWRALGRIPGPFVLLRELTILLRWWLFLAPADCRRVAEGLARSRSDLTRDDISAIDQELLRLARRWCIPPALAVEFGLTPRARGPAADLTRHALCHLYPSETLSWHQQRRELDAHPEAAHGLLLLQDKAVWADRARALGIASPQTLARVPAGDAPRLDTWWTPARALFCKPAKGSRGIDAFAVEPLPAQPEAAVARGVDGRTTLGRSAIEERWRRAVAAQDMLVQDLVQECAALTPLAGRPGSITVRVITRRPTGQDGWTQAPAVHSATLEIPHVQPGRFWLLQIDPRDGRSTARVTPAGADAPRLPTDWALPHWDRVLRQSVLAHEAVRGLPDVAWDWIVGDQAAWLLEGNASFGWVADQTLSGPMFKTPPVAQTG